MVISYSNYSLSSYFMQKNKILAVLRHGEANHDFTNDFQRELNAEGRSQLIRMRGLLKKTNINPERIISSAAVRTTQTTEIISEIFENSTIEYKREIYESEPAVILQSLAEVDKNVNTILLVGHNPGVSAVVSSIADQGYLSMQPGMLVILEVMIDDWKHLGEGTGIVREVLQ